jgi:hypothetical protein
MSKFTFLLAALLAGCHSSAPRVTTSAARANWNPSYYDEGMLHPGVSWWAAHTAHLLHVREGYDRFWKLVNLVLDVAPDSEYLVIVEGMPREANEENYWFAVAAWSKDGGRLFTSGVDLALRWADIDAQPGSDVWGKARKPEEFRDFLAALNTRDVWSGRSEAFEPKDGDHFAPWMIHLYRRADGQSRVLIFEGPHLSSDVVSGKAKIKSTPRDGIPQVHAQRWPRLDDQVRESIKRRYEESYDVRLVLNGMLRLAHISR